MTFVRVTDKGYWMDSVLMSNLNDMAHNMKHDFDMMFLITGSGKVRTGKSTLAQQIAYYISYKMHTPFTIDQVVFSGHDLINIAHKLPPNSAIIYDEARAELETGKFFMQVQRVLIDFFSECGKYNHFIILVMPDFFELNRKLAINRSMALANVLLGDKMVKDAEGNDVMEWVRGAFSYYGPKKKKMLYVKGKKCYDSYEAVKGDFIGYFRNFWLVDRDTYEEKKNKFLQRERVDNQKIRLAIALACLTDHVGFEAAAKELRKYGWTTSHVRVWQLISESLPEVMADRSGEFKNKVVDNTEAQGIPSKAQPI